MLSSVSYVQHDVEYPLSSSETAEPPPYAPNANLVPTAEKGSIQDHPAGFRSANPATKKSQSLRIGQTRPSRRPANSNRYQPILVARPAPVAADRNREFIAPIHIKDVAKLGAMVPKIDDINAKEGKTTALLAAIERQNEDKIKMLLDNGADLRIDDGNLGTALNSAIYGDSESIVKLFLDYEANPNVDLNGTSRRMLNLADAIYRDRRTMAKMLLDGGADPRIKESIHAAIVYHHKMWAVRLHLQYGAEVNSAQIAHALPYPPLANAAIVGDDKILPLMSKAGASASDSKSTPVKILEDAVRTAIYYNRNASDKLLLEACVAIDDGPFIADQVLD